MLNFVLSGDCNANWPLDAANCPLTSDWWATEGGAINKDTSERFAPQTDNEGLGSDNRNVLYFPTRSNARYHDSNIISRQLWLTFSFLFLPLLPLWLPVWIRLTESGNLMQPSNNSSRYLHNRWCICYAGRCVEFDPLSVLLAFSIFVLFCHFSRIRKFTPEKIHGALLREVKDDT